MDLSDLFVKYEDIIYLVLIILFVFLVFFILLYTSFFMIRIRGAQEENDDVYDLLKLGIVKYKNGIWNVNLGFLFNENAAIKIDFGWAYLKLFEKWEIEGFASGEKSGMVRSIVSENTVFLKRKVRRK